MKLIMFDALALIMLTLIGIIGGVVIAFSYRYMAADRNYGRFFQQIGALLISVGLLVCANYLPLFFGAWVISNLLLVELMRHNRWWPAANGSSLLARRYFILGFACMAIAFGLLAYDGGSLYISQLQSYSGLLQVGALGLLLITAMIQSALWPFNRWLLSSLNSPTPVSAFMHAGLVNGGGFLIVRFAHLYQQSSVLLHIMLVLGMISAVVGLFYKLIQTDVKRMLACSTMAQMGFVFVQCGFGLFSAAIAHLCWHGVFKAFLFLSSSTIQQGVDKKVDPVVMSSGLIAIMIGLCASYLFAFAHAYDFYGSTSFVLLVVAFVAAAQMALTLLRVVGVAEVMVAFVCSSVLALFYAMIDVSLEFVLPDRLVAAYSMNWLHVLAAAILFITWLLMVFSRQLLRVSWLYHFFARLYVWAVRTSLPDEKAMTLHRGQYRYKQEGV